MSLKLSKRTLSVKLCRKLLKIPAHKRLSEIRQATHKRHKQ